MDYIRRTSVGIHDEAEDVIKQTEEEYPDINPSVPVEVEKEDDPAEPGDNPQDFVDEGLDQPTATHPEIGRRGENPDAEYTRAIAFKAVQGDLEIETPHKFKQAEEAKERLSEIKQANEMLERSGHFRRYIPTDADAPDPAHIYEDEFGKYYYKAPDFNLRPSHVAEYTGKQAFPVLDDDEQIVKTVEFMVELSEDVMLDTMKSVEAADAWLERNMVLTDDEPGSKDTFSHGFKETVSFVVGGSGNSNKSVEKTPEGVPDNAVYLPPGEDA